MAMKYLKSKDKVLESWFNPVLSGNTNQGANILPPGAFPVGSPYAVEPGGFTQVQQQPCGDMIEKPYWLDNDDENLVMNGDILSIGSFFLNGVPLSSWSANFGSQGSYRQRQTIKNWHHLDALTQQLFPNGIAAFLNKDVIEDISISKLSIVRLVPHSNAIGLNAYVRFFVNDIEIWGKYENIGVDAKPRFVCGDLSFDQLPIENKMKITGRLWNTMSQWFQAKPGIYKCMAKEVLVYSELGQLKKLSEGNVIEVLHSDENRIKLKYDDTNYFVKKPTYYWFNWYWTAQ